MKDVKEVSVEFPALERDRKPALWVSTCSLLGFFFESWLGILAGGSAPDWRWSQELCGVLNLLKNSSQLCLVLCCISFDELPLPFEEDWGCLLDSSSQ